MFSNSLKIPYELMRISSNYFNLIAGFYWTGKGSNDNWSNSSNWNGIKIPSAYDSLRFSGTTRLTPFNDILIDTPFNGITFDPNSGQFQLYGNRFVLNSGGITNNSPNTQTINNDIKLNSGNNEINSNAGNITFNGILSGSGSIVKTGSNSANLSVARTITTGSITISAGTLQLDNLTTNGGFDLAGPVPIIYNLNGNGSSLVLYTNVGGINRISFNDKIINFNSTGSQTLAISGNILFNNLTLVTNGGLKKYIKSSQMNGSNYFNGQYTSIIYDVNGGLDDVDLEVNANLYNHVLNKKGSGNMSVITPYPIAISGPLNIQSGTFEIAGQCSIPLNFNVISGPSDNRILNNGTFSYSSSINSNCTNYTISGFGNLIKNGTSTLTLSSNKCIYTGTTSISGGSIITTKNTATATFTPTTLTVDFTVPPNSGDTFRFFSGSTVQTYPSVILTNSGGKTGFYTSSISTLTIS